MIEVFKLECIYVGRIRAAMGIVARSIKERPDGDRFLPIFRRLESELFAATERQAQIDRVEKYYKRGRGSTKPVSSETRLSAAGIDMIRSSENPYSHRVS